MGQAMAVPSLLILNIHPTNSACQGESRATRCDIRTKDPGLPAWCSTEAVVLLALRGLLHPFALCLPPCSLGRTGHKQVGWGHWDTQAVGILSLGQAFTF